jgi:hypothetical protein
VDSNLICGIVIGVLIAVVVFAVLKGRGSRGASQANRTVEPAQPKPKGEAKRIAQGQGSRRPGQGSRTPGAPSHRPAQPRPGTAEHAKHVKHEGARDKAAAKAASDRTAKRKEVKHDEKRVADEKAKPDGKRVADKKAKPGEKRMADKKSKPSADEPEGRGTREA